ncbi:MAG: alpha/beta fold hydrolase [Deltaproteobacteria bacterium]|nr:alpha/beta fold hydrolase [Deltaproteobacteria bacterium]
MTDAVTIPGRDVTLEGRCLSGAAGPGVVITHPHPLFGGSMNNNVVWTAERAFHSRGWATLCFNFRGVGRSTGSYGGGEAEVADVAAALGFLRERTSGPHYLVGYSFGALVVGRALLQGLEPEGAVLISPPVAFMEMSWLPQAPRLKLIIAGDRDELGPLIDLQAMMAAVEPPVPIIVIKGAGHFFGGREEKLFQVLRDFPL